MILKNLKKIYLILIFFIFMIFYIENSSIFAPVETLDIPIGVGYDLISNTCKDPIYNVSLSVYQFLIGTPTLNTITIEGQGCNIVNTREERQTKSNRKYILGTEKVLLISEYFAQRSINPIVNVLFNNTYANDTARVAIFKGKAKDALNFKVEGYNSSADYLKGMIDSSANYNFFSKNYKMIDVYTRILAKGRSIAIPYIEIQDGTFKITGLGIFKGDKLKYVANIKEAKIINLLREDRVFGIININNEQGESIGLKTLSMNNIKCDKEGDKYKFNINLNLNCDIIQDTMYKNILNNPSVTNKIEKQTEEVVKKMADSFINKMQKEIKIDCLELGRVAASKCNRKDNIDWNKVVCESEIKVNVKVKLERIGRGIL